MDGQPEAIGNADRPSGRIRSTIGFPYMDLKTAMTLVDALHQNVGTGECDDSQLAAWTGQSAKSSGFRVQVYTARMFGLLDGEGSRHKLTALGRQAVDPSQARAAKAAAFLKVPLYQAVFDKYKGGVIPPPAALERDMVQLGVSEKQKDKARQAFERSADQAGFFEHGKDRLVQPGIIAGSIPPAHDPTPARNGNGNGSGDGTPPDDTDPLIKALIQKLPKAKDWSIGQRVAWLQMVAMALQVNYGGDDEIEIAVKPKSS